VLALEERFNRGGEEVMGSTSARVWSMRRTSAWTLSSTLWKASWCHCGCARWNASRCATDADEATATVRTVRRCSNWEEGLAGIAGGSGSRRGIDRRVPSGLGWGHWENFSKFGENRWNRTGLNSKTAKFIVYCFKISEKDKSQQKNM
jgi:hypothetical protein